MKSVFKRLSPVLQNVLLYLYEQRTRPVLIVGNGPSLASIDYSRYPHNPLVVRLNNFFFEDKYYVGKNVDFLLCATHHKRRLLAYYVTLQKIIIQGDYTFSDEACIGTPYKLESYKNHNPYYPIVNLQELFFLVPYVCAIHSSLYVRDFVYATHPTTGMSALMAMVLLGFSTIYIAGIDFYSENSDSVYVYNMEEKVNMRKQYIEDISSYTAHEYNKGGGVHNKNLDMECLYWCQEQTNNRIYSLCPTASTLNSIIPLAKKQSSLHYTPQVKAEHTLKDYVYIHI